MRLIPAALAAALVGGVVIWQASGPSDEGSAAKAEVEGAPLAKVRLPQSPSSEAQMGKRAFDARCATCHGENAAGRAGIAPPLVHRIYAPGHHGDLAFLLAAQNGVRAHHWPFGDMPPVADVTPGEVKLIVRYIRELQAANGIR
ncbi:c-type cytochrome [Oceanicella actignis]|uniref:Cytochrome C oxidase, cbb3-type, subunit III n=1 Tax=Oceanicella actignis TaxID=1189325 RepID=A0A1M7TWX6_9RHOB|nr:cytochrome c [Oceanicella actignis]SET79606.1 Cytochrome C oxidase, cbb3-type, subunit III [Oceanicella actignis]SHN75200.1 Cytochrome C oxidase, cbb3-type, subunit III [Oceanicella actignis]